MLALVNIQGNPTPPLLSVDVSHSKQDSKTPLSLCITSRSFCCHSLLRYRSGLASHFSWSVVSSIKDLSYSFVTWFTSGCSRPPACCVLVMQCSTILPVSTIHILCHRSDLLYLSKSDETGGGFVQHCHVLRLLIHRCYSLSIATELSAYLCLQTS